MGKGSRDRTSDKAAYDACPLWANLEKKKMEEKANKEKLEEDQIVLTPHGEKEASGSGEVFMDKTPDGDQDKSMEKLANLHGK